MYSHANSVKGLIVLKSPSPNLKLVSSFDRFSPISDRSLILRGRINTADEYIVRSLNTNILRQGICAMYFF